METFRHSAAEAHPAQRITLASSLRQLLAYGLVVASGFASLATSDCSETIAVSSPPLLFELGPAGSSAEALYRVRSNVGVDGIAVRARLVLGNGSVEVAAPGLALDAGSTTLSVGSAEASATLCAGACAPSVPLVLTRTSGDDPASLELVVEATSHSFGCDVDEYFIVEHVR